MNEQQKQIQVKVPEAHKPVFANSAQVTVTNEEVVLQFLYVRPNTTHGTLVSEVVLTPQHAIKFQKALDETIKKHFTKHLK
jgi:hypothetical protein